MASRLQPPSRSGMPGSTRPSMVRWRTSRRRGDGSSRQSKPSALASTATSLIASRPSSRTWLVRSRRASGRRPTGCGRCRRHRFAAPRPRGRHRADGRRDPWPAAGHSLPRKPVRHPRGCRGGCPGHRRGPGRDRVLRRRRGTRQRVEACPCDPSMGGRSPNWRRGGHRGPRRWDRWRRGRARFGTRRARRTGARTGRRAGDRDIKRRRRATDRTPPGSASRPTGRVHRSRTNGLIVQASASSHWPPVMSDSVSVSSANDHRNP